MAAPILRYFRISSCTSFTSRFYRCSLCRHQLRSEQVEKLKLPFARCLLLSVAGLKAESVVNKKTDLSSSRSSDAQHLQSSASSDQPMTFEPNDPRLKGSECLKNAARLAVDSTSAVLSQTVYEVGRIEDEYVKLMNVLVLLMEYQLQVLGHTAEEQRIADLIVQTRHEINEIRRRRQDLEFLFASVTKLADATAEVAFTTGANYASTSTGERLASATREIQRVQSSSEEVEKTLQLTEVKSIEMLTKHEEKKEKQRAAEEEQRKHLEEESESETSKGSSQEEEEIERSENENEDVHNMTSGAESQADEGKTTQKKRFFSF